VQVQVYRGTRASKLQTEEDDVLLERLGFILLYCSTFQNATPSNTAVKQELLGRLINKLKVGVLPGKYTLRRAGHTCGRNQRILTPPAF
jgi:hypothetical protein